MGAQQRHINKLIERLQYVINFKSVNLVVAANLGIPFQTPAASSIFAIPSFRTGKTDTTLHSMSLKVKIDAAIKTAMLAKEQTRLLALRSIKSLILLEATKEGGNGELSEESEMKILNKAAKQRRDSLDIFKQQGRADLAEKEQAELSVIEEFLPKQLTAEELEVKIREFVAQVGAAGPQDMGKVMGVATKGLAGLADGKAVSETVKKILAGG
jgi:uncharacterized protein YqeY